MSGYLWKSYLEDDVATFRAVLESAGLSARAAASKSLGGGPGIDGVDHECASPPHTPAKHGRGQPPTPQGLVLARADLNHRDSQGRTLLHLAASSSAPTAILFARALLEHPLTDIYLQDSENGWTALHRAFYAGNASIALAILSRDSDDSRTAGTVSLRQGGLVKIKDHEGNGPFDVLEETLDEIDRSGSDYFIYQPEYEERPLDWIDPPAGQRPHRTWQGPWNHTGGDEVYTFGSNKNMTLGFGDEDDRHYPERSILKRPEYLIEKYLVRSQERAGSDRKTFLTQFVLPKELSRVPFSIRYNPCRIQDVVMGKYSSAILTSDISSNLHLCGHGTSGRLGLGTQETMYQFTCVEGPLEGRRVVAVALGHHHTLALCTGGDVFSWGSNALGQLGYVLPNQSKDDDPMQLLPRQIYGTLKREKILGIAASGIHSVCFNEGSIFTFGKNEGQLGIMDADARSLSTQSTPRKVGGQQFSHRIRAVSAIDRATICLLDNHDVWVYANYGYSKVLFVNDPFSNQYLQSMSDPGNDTAANHHAKESARSRLSLVIKVASGGDTICALTTLGEIYSITIGKPAVTGQHSSTSTTNPAKIRSALSQPQRIWSNRKSRMAARDLDVDQNGSVILATRAGGVWRRTKRAQIKDANANGSSDYREKDYKFSRIPGLTSALGVRASGFGAYAAVRKEFELHVHSRIKIESTLREDLFHLSPFKSWESILEKSGEAHHSTVTSFALALARRFKDGCPDPDSLFRDIFSESSKSHGFEPDLVMCTSSSDVGIPFHQFLAAACGPGLQRGLFKCWRTGAAYEDETCMISKENGGLRLVFRRLDVLTVVNLAYFATTGTVLPMWQQQSARMESRLRNVRSETSRLAWALKNKNLENAFRSDAEQSTGLEAFFSYLPAQPSTLPGTDAVIELEDGEIRAHSVLLCQRCPFFSGLFLGRARGMWVADRMTDGAIRIDFSHVEMWIFERVLRWVYTDASETLFEDLIAEDVDDYLDKIFDVLGLANELMIDMLVKVCQKAISKHVTVQNVGFILSSVAPYQIDDLKVDCLEYICYNLEAVLRTGQLNDLDDDLLLEIDQALRRHQMKTAPFTRSGALETELQDRNPGLPGRILQERRAKIDSIVLFNKYAESYGKAPSSFKAGSFHANDVLSAPKTKAKSSHALGSSSPPVSPRLRGKASSDFIFDMDEDHGLSGQNARRSSSAGLSSSLGPSQDRKNSIRGGALDHATPNEPGGESPEAAFKTRRDAGTSKKEGPWSSATDFSTQKASMKDIMAQASLSRTSNISIGLAKNGSRGGLAAASAKLSQKERKKLQQQAAQNVAPVAGSSKAGANQSPWKPIEGVRRGKTGEPSSPIQTGRTTPQLTMRQTVANPGNYKVPSDKTPSRASGQESRQPDLDSTPQKPPTSPVTPRTTSTTVQIQSIRHTPLPARASSSTANLSMADIQSMQQAEKIIAQGGGEKRSLAEIQAEQAFQEWWDKESARVQGEESASVKQGGRQNRSRGASRGGAKRRGRSRDASGKAPAK